jgi:Fe-S-cluster containining protein
MPEEPGSFPCAKCGLCCRMLKDIPALAAFDNGNGVCRYLENNLCSIYENRPMICNVEAMYSAFFKSIMSKKDFIIINIKSCKKITEQFKIRKIK